MLNNFKNLKLMSDVIKKQQVLENKIRAKNSMINYFSNEEKIKIVEKYGTEEHLGNGIILDIFKGIKRMEMYNENDLFINFGNTSQVDARYSIEVWSPRAFKNREDVLDSESEGNEEIMRNYQDILVSLRDNLPEQN